MFQWTSITEWLHPAVPAVKTLPFFRKYFHSTIIASICSYTVATLAMSLRLSEIAAERVANVCVPVWTSVDACTLPSFNHQRGGNWGWRNEGWWRHKELHLQTRLHARAASYCCLMAGLTQLTFADELPVQTPFDTFTQTLRRLANSEITRGGVPLATAWKYRGWHFRGSAESQLNVLHEKKAVSFRIKRRWW